VKKAINILVSVIFLMSFIGVQVHKHYSQGKLFSTAIYTEAESCCESMETCEMTNMSASCQHQKQGDCSCKNDTETFKLNSNFVVNEKQKIVKISMLDLGLVSSYYISNIIILPNIFPIPNISPPQVEIDVQSYFGIFLC
jgi:hypothetical protein